MKLLLSMVCLLALSVSAAFAQTSSTTTTSTSADTARAQGPDATTTTENVGTISEFTPGTTLVLSSGSGEPTHYKLAKNVTYVNAKGKVITADRIRKDRKVRVHYTKEGNDMVVDKVTIVKD